MKVLSDSSPLITLAKTGNLELLRALYGSITVTPEVFEESVVSAEGLAGASLIAAAVWIQVQATPASSRTLGRTDSIRYRRR